MNYGEIIEIKGESLKDKKMFGKEKLEQRKKEFKRTVDVELSRKKREEQSISIRKIKRDQNVFKKRNVPLLSSPSKIETVQLKELPNLVQSVASNDSNLQLEATREFRKLLSIEKNPPIQEIINAGVVPRFIQFLSFSNHPQLQFEAAWALTNIASGSSEQTRIVIEKGAVPIFVQLMSSPNDEVREQAVWALGNIAGDSPLCRDFVLNHGALMPILQQLHESSKVSMLRNATWTLSNLCRGKPQPRFECVRPALPILARLIYSIDDEVLTDACWALSYLSDGPNEKIQAVLEVGVGRRMVELLIHPSPAVQTPALRTVGNIVTGDDLQTQVIINVSVLPCLLTLLHSQKKGIRKEACWTISNITAGNKFQIQAVMDANIFPILIELLNSGDFDIKKEAAWAISNATSGGTPEQIRYLVSQGCIPPLCDLLSSNDARIIMVALEGLENILRSGEGENEEQIEYVNPYTGIIEECDGLDKIEQLQGHPNHEIYDKAIKILEDYFHAEEDTVEQNNNISHQGGYAFNPPGAPPQQFRF